MSSNITKPTRPGAPALQRPGTPSRPAAVAPPVRPSAPAAPKVEADPFADEVTTAGIPLEQAMAQNLKGSQMFGQQPAPEDPFAGEDELDLFADEGTQEGAPPPLVTGEDGGELLEDEEDFGDDDPNRQDEDEDEGTEEAVEEDIFGDAFSETPFVETPPAKVAAPPAKPKAAVAAPTKAAPPVQGKVGFKRLQDNNSIVYDNKLTQDLSTVAAARHVWETLRKPYDQMSDPEKYTRQMASDIIVADREGRYQASRLLAEAILRETDDMPIPEEGLEVSMVLGKDAPQSQQGETLGQTRTREAITRTNKMMDKCQNRGVGCTSMRLNHLQATGKCFLPDCTCKGACQGFVESQGTGGETAQGETKSNVIPPQVTRPAGSGVTVPTRPAQASAGSNVPARPTGTNTPVAASKGTSPQGGGQAAIQRAAASSTPQRPANQGGSGGVRPAPPSRPSQAAQDTGVNPGVGQERVEVSRPKGQAQQGGSSQDPRAVTGTSVQQGGASQGAASQTQPEGSNPQPGEEPLITGELLEWIIATGGNGPDHSDYWPSIPNPDMREGVDDRRRYIRGRFVKYWDNAIHEEKPLGETGVTRVMRDQEFDLHSTSYRVVLAANKLSELFETFAVAPYVEGYQGEETDEQLSKQVGAAAKAYLEAHRPLPAGKSDMGWSEYLELVETFKDSGLKVGMLIHEFEAQTATQQQQG